LFAQSYVVCTETNVATPVEIPVADQEITREPGRFDLPAPAAIPPESPRADIRTALRAYAPVTAAHPHRPLGKGIVA
jgi:hypothetical protein